MKKLEPSRRGVRDIHFQENGDVTKSRLKFLTQYILISVFLQCCEIRRERKLVPNFQPSHKAHILRKRTLRLGAFVSWKLRNHDWGNNLFLLHWPIERFLTHRARLVESHIVDVGTNYRDDVMKGVIWLSLSWARDFPRSFSRDRRQKLSMVYDSFSRSVLLSTRERERGSFHLSSKPFDVIICRVR